MKRSRFAYIASAGITVNVLLLVAVLGIVLVEFILDEVPEVIVGGFKFGQIFVQLSLAYVVSYIFYLLVVVIPTHREKGQLATFIGGKSRQLVHAIRAVTHEVQRGAGQELIEYPTEEQLTSALRQFSLQDPAPGSYRSPITGCETWRDFFLFWKRLAEERSDRLLSQSQYMEADHIRLVLNIQECTFYSIFDLLGDVVPSNPDATILARMLWDVSEFARELDEYCGEHFPKPE